MALQFQPPPQPQGPTPTQAALAPVTQAIGGIPALMLQHQQLKRQQQLDDLAHQKAVVEAQTALAEARRKYGTGAAAPTMDSGATGSTLNPGPLSAPNGGEDFLSRTVAAPETPEEKLNRLGEDAYKLLNPTEKQSEPITNVTRKEFLANPDKYATGKLNIVDEETPQSLSLGEKTDQYQKKRLTDLGNALDPSQQTRGAFATSKSIFDRAERLETLGNNVRDAMNQPNPDRRQIEEIAIGLNSLLSGSNTGSVEQVKALVPRSIVGDANKFKEWLSNEPQGAGQQKFVQRLLDTVAREKATASDQITRTQLQRIQRYADLEKTNPDEFYNVIQSAGIEPQDYKAWRSGGFKSKSAVQTPENMQTVQTPEIHNQALDWANANPNDPRAAAIRQKAQAALGVH